MSLYQASPSSPPLSRPLSSNANKQQAIDRLIRGHVLSGVWSPGFRIPTRHQLEKQFSCSSVTLQRAIDRLVLDGFLVSRGRLGTFVVDAPPNSNRFALFFNGNRSSVFHSRFYLAMQRECQKLLEDENIQITLYGGKALGLSFEDLEAVEAAIIGHRLAGIIFAGQPVEWSDTPILDGHSVPRICLAPEFDHPDVIPLAMDNRVMYQDAFHYLKQAGGGRVGIVTVPSIPIAVETILELADKAGLICHPSWIQGQVQEYAPWVSQQVQLLLEQPPEHRPDSLFIADDNLVKPAIKGIKQAGLSLDSIQVIAHANFPVCQKDYPCIPRIGYFSESILQHAIEMCHDVRAGKKVRRRVIKPVLFSDPEDLPIYA